MGEAYAVLSDANKRIRYDNGEDLDDPTGGMHSKFNCYVLYDTFIYDALSAGKLFSYASFSSPNVSKLEGILEIMRQNKFVTRPGTIFFLFPSYTQNHWKGVTLVKLSRAPLQKATVRL